MELQASEQLVFSKNLQNYKKKSQETCPLENAIYRCIHYQREILGDLK